MVDTVAALRLFILITGFNVVFVVMIQCCGMRGLLQLQEVLKLHGVELYPQTLRHQRGTLMFGGISYQVLAHVHDESNG